ncbi:unnamed protein product [Auanema sp. JU1783]|nr:unnamed protein product [Auanema sp. JU1783]
MITIHALEQMMKERICCDVSTELPVQLPGYPVKGTISINFIKPSCITNISARLLGDGEVNFTSKEHYHFYNRRVYVDETQELWRHSTINKMLDMQVDQNQNSSRVLQGRFSFNFNFNLPDDCVTSFHCPNSPVSIRYMIEFRFYTGEAYATHEHGITVLAPIGVRRDSIIHKSVHSKIYRFPKDREIFLECTLDRTIFRTADPIAAHIVVTNKWKQSLKYVHMSIVRCITAEGYMIDNSKLLDKHTAFIDTTGVGLPSSHPKIAIGETFNFCPDFNVPALPPSMDVGMFMTASYYLKIAIGRAHNYVLATLKIPITIVTDVLEADSMITPVSYDDMLVDLSPTVSSPATSFPQVVDLLA